MARIVAHLVVEKQMFILSPAGQDRMKSKKRAVGFGIILCIKGCEGWSCYGYRNRKSDSCVPAE
jgi:hypothetical protein